MSEPAHQFDLVAASLAQLGDQIVVVLVWQRKVIREHIRAHQTGCGYVLADVPNRLVK